ncbi:DUF4365 domain-containing protein [Mucilaginibacter sp. UC70_90]
MAQKPTRHPTHILERQSRKYFEQHLPDEWIDNVPANDYGIDYQVDIAINNQVTGLFFSAQLKSTETCKHKDGVPVILKHTTLNFYRVRPEPVMLVAYVAEEQEAYWSWIDDLAIDLSRPNKTYQIIMPRDKKLSSVDWQKVYGYVVTVFNKRSFLDNFDISGRSGNEIAAWKSYYENDFESAAYLFKKLPSAKTDPDVLQALAWSQYSIFHFAEALQTINQVLELKKTAHNYQVKACISTEYGIRSQNKAMLLQGKTLFGQYIDEKADALSFYNYGNALGALQEFEEAAKQYKISLKKNPNHAECWKNLGTTYWELGEHEKEMDCYNKALAINPDLEEALFSKGVTLSKIFGRYDEALVLFKRIIKDHTGLLQGFPRGLFWIGYTYEQKGDIYKALEWYDKGLEYLPDELPLLNAKSNLLAHYWRKDEILKEKAKTFFEFRFALDNDVMTLFHYLDVSQFSDEKTFALIAEKTPVTGKLTYDQFSLLSIPVDALTNSLLTVPLYAELRKTYPLKDYAPHVTSEHYAENDFFWDALDLFCLVMLSKAIKKNKKRETGAMINAEKDFIGMYFTNLLSLLLPVQDFEQKIAISVMSSLSANFPFIAIREVALHIGYLTGMLQLPRVELSNYLEDWKGNLFEKVFLALNKIFRLLPDE